MFNLKCSPGGRHLWQLGTSVIDKIGADSLQNCWHVAIDDPIESFCFMFNELMLGGGVGFNVLPQHVYSLPEVKHDVEVLRIDGHDVDFIVPDNREGWVELLRKILTSFFFTGKDLTYSTVCIRARGKPIKTFGGTASGSEDLVIGINNIVNIIKRRVGHKLRPIDCLDIANIIGSIVVAGNVRRSAEISLGDPLDPDFIDAKNWNKITVPDWRQMSNNSVVCDDIGILPESFWSNYNGEGEPSGLFNLKNARLYGRIADGLGYRPDSRVTGMNPCTRGDTLITTSLGDFMAKELVGQKFEILTDQGYALCNGFFSTGVQEIVRVESESRVIFVTPNHRFKLADGTWTEANSLTLKSEVLIFDGQFSSERILRLENWDTDEVFDCQVPGPNNYISNGFVSHNCGEITLESYESCVSGDTRIYTDLGSLQIASLVGRKVKVWNGEEWSQVTPRVTGHNRELFRVTLSDGSYLDCTSNHSWPARSQTENFYRRTDTLWLKNQSYIEPFQIAPLQGPDEPFAYEWGVFAGDGFIDKKQVMVAVCKGKEALAACGTAGRFYNDSRIDKIYQTKSSRLNLTHELDHALAVELNDKTTGIPDYFFQMNKASTLEFIAGYIDTDGNIANKGKAAEGYRVYGAEKKMRDLQLLCRRAGINSTRICEIYPKGHKTNMGTRNYALWYIQIPSYECKEIPTRLKAILKFGEETRENPAHPGTAISIRLLQRVISIEKLPGLHTTYCFDEPLRHMGVFNNVLTYQCNLQEIFLPNIENINEFALAAELMFKLGKTVSCVPFSNPKTQEVVNRNHRIGVGVTGMLQALHYMESHVFDAVYKHLEVVDKNYSKVLKCDESIKLTTVKPSGTLSLLAGVTPGIHPAFSDYYIRRIRFASDDPLVVKSREAGYHVEPRLTLDGTRDMKTMIVEFPIATPPGTVLADEMSAVEQLDYALFMQTHWSDNSVSVTVYYSEEEMPDIRGWLNRNYNSSCKSLSFLLRSGHGFKQAPLEAISEEKYKELSANTNPITKVHDLKETGFADEVECAGGFCPVK